MPRARRGGPAGPLKSAVTKGVTSSKSSRGGKRGGLLGKIKAARAKKAVPNRGSSRAAAAKARAAVPRVGAKQRGPKETPLRASAKPSVAKRKPTLKGKPKGKGFKRIKGAIITRRAGG